MGVNESIRGNVADVYVQTDDIRDCAVTTAKIADGAVSAAKLAGGSLGQAYAGVLTGSATSGYVTLVTVTSNTTFFFGAVQVTAAGTSGGVSLVNSDAAALVNEIAISDAAANYTNFDTALSTTKIVEVTAGASLYALYTTGTATANFRAKYFVQCIATPS